MLFKDKIYKITFNPRQSTAFTNNNRKYREKNPVSNEYYPISDRDYSVKMCCDNLMYIVVLDVFKHPDSISPCVYFLYNGKYCCGWLDMGIFSKTNTFELME